MLSLRKFKWNDSPDDRDLFKKTFCASKTAAKYGTLMAVADVVLTRENRTNWEKAYRFGYHIVPLVGMATAFTVTMHISTKLTPKWDHKLHYLMGGLAAGGIAGHWQKSGVVGLNTAVGLGLVAMFYQYCRERVIVYKGTQFESLYTWMITEEMWKPVREQKRQSSSWFFHDMDYRIFKNKTRSNDIDYVDF